MQMDWTQQIVDHQLLFRECQNTMISICYALCGDDGKPDLSTKRTVIVPADSNLRKMAAKFELKKKKVRSMPAPVLSSF